MDNAKHSKSSMPLASRLDHLDFIMKYLERKQNFQKWCGRNSSAEVERNCMPMDLALKEACYKGSLLDRVASIEQRLSQLFLDVGSSSTSRTSPGTSSTLTSGETSSQGSKRESSSTFPTFSTPISGRSNYRPISSQTHFTTTLEIQEDSNREQQKRTHPSPPKLQLRKNRPNYKDDKSNKRGKIKKTPPAWPHLKLLGC
ncbi:uncharacterized protein LOC107430533 [Ziziphus jujuba]|uniref:Uncharacterized protein LOC107430533 n=1 Tax=Ziziphus jujuba TaxID=326968 RepID=A0A6P4B4B3_ZIZJJ|nr:uncharacterized protein LOC107430533 [Ziziphus jujuba]